MSLLIRGGAVDETVPPMQDGEVVDKVNVSGPRLELEPRGFGDLLNHIQRFQLAGRKLWEMRGSGMAGAAEQSCSSEIGHQASLLKEDDGPALKFWAFLCQPRHSI